MFNNATSGLNGSFIDNALCTCYSPCEHCVDRTTSYVLSAVGASLFLIFTSGVISAIYWVKETVESMEERSERRESNARERDTALDGRVNKIERLVEGNTRALNNLVRKCSPKLPPIPEADYNNKLTGTEEEHISTAKVKGSSLKPSITLTEAVIHTPQRDIESGGRSKCI